MKLTKKQRENILDNLVDNGLYYCNRCESYFILRNTCDGEFNSRTCPCCGITSDDIIEDIEEDD